MGDFLDIIGFSASVMTISGVSLRELLQGKKVSDSDKHDIELFIKFLEGRQVLFAEMDDEVQGAVVRSLEEIKIEVENLRLKCRNDYVSTILLDLLLKMSKSLQKLHSIDGASQTGLPKIYVALQGVRIELARALALLCAAFGIEPCNKRMKSFILTFGVRPGRA